MTLADELKEVIDDWKATNEGEIPIDLLERAHGFIEKYEAQMRQHGKVIYG